VSRSSNLYTSAPHDATDLLAPTSRATER